jgi:hypothetical protein
VCSNSPCVKIPFVHTIRVKINVISNSCGCICVNDYCWARIATSLVTSYNYNKYSGHTKTQMKPRNHSITNDDQQEESNGASSWVRHLSLSFHQSLTGSIVFTWCISDRYWYQSIHLESSIQKSTFTNGI